MSRVADLDRRCYASAVDRLLDVSVAAAVTVLVAHPLWTRGHELASVLVVVSGVLAVELVLAVLLGTTGATPGKAVLGLRLVQTGTARPIGVGPATVRTAVLGLAAVPFGLGLAALARSALADGSGLRRGWHDQLVSSVLLDVRPVPPAEVVADALPPPRVVNLTALRLVPARPTSGAAARMPPVPVPPVPVPSLVGAVTWALAFDSGERLVVDTLLLVGRRPEPGPGEQGARLVALPSADGSLSATHAHVVVAADGALVVTDRGSSAGSTLVRRSASRPLTPGRPTTLLPGDVLVLGDRTMHVRCPG